MGLALYLRRNFPLPQSTSTSPEPLNLKSRQHGAPVSSRTPRKCRQLRTASHHAPCENYGYTPFMSKDAASNGGGDLRDRSLAAAISVALHIAAVTWIWFVGDQAGRGKSEAQGHSGSYGMSASFVPADEFRQHIEIKPSLAGQQASATLQELSESAPTAPVESAGDLPDKTEPAETNISSSLDATAPKSEIALASLLDAGLTQGGDNAGGNNDDGLRAAYLAALRAAIRQHWNHEASPQHCSVTIKQSPGGAVQSATTGACSLSPQERRTLEAAALMAQPLPYTGFEAVYADAITIEI